MKHKQNINQTSLWTVFFWCLAYLRPHKRRFFFFIGTGLVFTLAELVIPKLIQYFIDHIQKQNEMKLLIVLLIVAGAILLVMFMARSVHNLLQRRIQEEISRDLQYDLFSKLRQLGFAYYEKHATGESLSLMNTEVTALQNFFKDKFPASIRYFLFSTLSVIIMISISWQLSLIMLPCLALYYVIGPYLERKASLSARDVVQKRVDYNQKVYESISALTELRANDAQKWDQRNLLHKLKHLNASLLATDFYALCRGSVRRLTYYIGAIVMFILGPYLVIQQTITIGAFIAFILYYFDVMQRLTVFITLITDQKLIIIQAKKLYELMHLTPEVQEVKHPIKKDLFEGKIEFKNVSFAYELGRPVIDRFNLTIEAGERVAFVGKSGNGKTTLLKLLARFYDPAEGEILIDGIPISKMSFQSLRENIGYVFQETYLFGASVRDNIAFGNPEATEEQVIEAAKAANAHDFIMELPDGYHTRLGERGVLLSGGQKQRISIARVLIKNPQVILLDEATSALDHVTEYEVQKALERLFKGRTTIAVAHRLSTIKDYDKIVFLEAGKVAQIGTYSELMSKQGLFYQLEMGAQMAKEGGA